MMRMHLKKWARFEVPQGGPHARVVSAVAGGRILNAKTASSQIMGAVVESVWHFTKKP